MERIFWVSGKTNNLFSTSSNDYRRGLRQISGNLRRFLNYCCCNPFRFHVLYLHIFLLITVCFLLFIWYMGKLMSQDIARMRRMVIRGSKKWSNTASVKVCSLPNVSFNSSIPVYYINLDRSKDRRECMEMKFNSSSGGVHRVQAVDGLDKDQVLEIIDIGNSKNNHVSSLDELIEICSASNVLWKRTAPVTLGELSLGLSHLKAYKAALDDNVEMALILEDDASLDLLPFWDSSIDDLIANHVEKQFPNWTLLRLQYVYHGTNLLKKWTDQPKYRVLRQDDYVCNDEVIAEKCYGTAAQILHRRGLQRMVDLFFTSSNRIDLTKKTTHHNCPSDEFIPAQLSQFGDVLVSTPPLITVTYHEGSTNIRCSKNCQSSTDKNNDHQSSHRESTIMALQWSYEAKQIRAALTD